MNYCEVMMSPPQENGDRSSVNPCVPVDFLKQHCADYEECGQPAMNKRDGVWLCDEHFDIFEPHRIRFGKVEEIPND